MDASKPAWPAGWHVPILFGLVAGTAWLNKLVTAKVLAAGDTAEVVDDYIPSLDNDKDGNRVVPPPPPPTYPLGAAGRTTPHSYTALQLTPYLLTGITFSLGLILSGMVSPLKVIGFLRFPPPMAGFDPSLALVFLGGVVPNAIHWRGVVPVPKLPWEKWRVPSRTDIDWRLVLGSLLFGLGWGLAGVCPGPAVVAGGQLSWNLLASVGAKGPDAVFGVDGAALLGWAAFADLLVLGMAAAKGLDKLILASGPHVHPKKDDDRDVDKKVDH